MPFPFWCCDFDWSPSPECVKVTATVTATNQWGHELVCEVSCCKMTCSWNDSWQDDVTCCINEKLADTLQCAYDFLPRDCELKGEDYLLTQVGIALDKLLTCDSVDLSTCENCKVCATVCDKCMFTCAFKQNRKISVCVNICVSKSKDCECCL